MQSFAESAFKLTGIQLSHQQLAAFDTYANQLVEWNQRFNLTSITDREQIEVKHFLDSLSCWPALRSQPRGHLIDVGAGAGFPGLPLKILQPELQLTLLEATAKKATFLEHIVQVLRLDGVTVVAKRAEELGQMAEYREGYDWALARAVAPMSTLAEYLLPLVKVGGHALAQKGRGAKDEVEAANSAVARLGGVLSQLVRVELPALDEERWLVVLSKVVPTPAAYPRRPGMPSKRPLD